MISILSVHNHYQQRGGEDESTALEVELCRSRGHRVIEYRQHNDRIARMRTAAVAARTVWSRESYREVRALLRAERPDVVHVQNSFPLISPSVYYAARREGVPVVQTVRNYRLFCPSAVFFRDGRACEECLGRAVPMPAVVHGCYRQARSATAVVAGMLTIHRLLRTYARMVDVYVALTHFARAKMVEGGIPAGKIVVKPNFVEPGPAVSSGTGGYALFVGRLSEEKGVASLVEAWRQVGDVPLRIVGDGPLGAELEERIRRHSLGDTVQMLGRRSRDQVRELLCGARFLVFPSIWYETFGRVAIEAFACGVPVIAARIGAIAEVVEEGVTGLCFTPGDAADLAAKVRWAWGRREEMEAMGRRARREYEERYTPEHNYRILMNVYERAVTGRIPIEH